MMHYRKIKNVGIIGYGNYIPRKRITVREIASAHGADGAQVERSLGVREKSVANWDEDTATMAYMASRETLEMADIPAAKIGAIYVGSESHPYAVKPTSTILGEALGVGNWYMAADLEFACKAATAGIEIVASQIISGFIDYGLVVGADKAQAEPGDALEYTAAAGAGALILGKEKVVAKLEGFVSYASDTADFWRRSEQKYPAHAGRFTGEPAYFRHVVESTKRYLEVSTSKASDFDHVVFHMPNGKFPKRAAERLGFSEKQLNRGLVVEKIGNPYSASSLIGLCMVLDEARSGERILVTAYGSGSGADTLVFKTTESLEKVRKKQNVDEIKPEFLSYGEYRALQD